MGLAGPGQTEAGLNELGALPFEKAEYALKAAFPPAELAGVLADLVGPRPDGGGGPVSAHAATGVLWMASDAREGELQAAGDRLVPTLARSVAEARERLAARGGSLVLHKASPELKRAVDVWGPPGDAIGLMRRVKERFDPDRRLAPGRFVGGI